MADVERGTCALHPCSKERTSLQHPIPWALTFTSVLFLGWGADYEFEFLSDCDYTPTQLETLWSMLTG